MGVFDAIIEKYSTANTPVSPLGTFAAIGDAWDKFHSKERGLLPFLADLLFDREAMQRRSERNPVPANAEVLAGTPLPYPGLAGAALDIGMATLPLGAEGVTLASPAWAKRGGKGALAMLQALAKQAELKPSTPLQEKINAKREVYHATDLEGFKGILESGEIAPNPWLHQGLGAKKQKELMKQGKKNVSGWFKDTPETTPDGMWEKHTTKDGMFSVQKDPLTSKWEIVDVENDDFYGSFDSLTAAKSEVDKIHNAVSPLLGVSVSRVPRIAPKESKAITFVIDESKLPRSRPLAEEGYRKTFREQGWGDWMQHATPEEINKYNHLAAVYNNAGSIEAQAHTSKIFQDYANSLKEKYKSIPVSKPNPLFEYELRTYNEPIPLRDRTGMPVVKEILVDKSALPQEPWGKYTPETIPPDKYDALMRGGSTLEDLFARAFAAGIPLRTFESGPQMHAARAGSYGRSPQGLSFGAHRKPGQVPIAGGPDPALAKPLTASSLAEQLGDSKPTPGVIDFSKITNEILKAMAPQPLPNIVKEP